MQRFWGIVDREALQPVHVSLLFPVIATIVALTLTWLVRQYTSIDLPFLFCIGAVVAAALHGGFLAALLAMVLGLSGSVAVAAGTSPLVTSRNLLVVGAFCLGLAVVGEFLLRAKTRERAESARATHRERILQLIFGQSPAVTLVVDDQGSVIAANAAAADLFARPRETLLGHPIEDLVDQSAGPSSATVSRPDGETRQVALSTVSLAIADRPFSLVYVRDETDVRNAADELAVTQRELHQVARATSLGQLGSSIAHELNQPLASAANYAEAAKAMLVRSAPDVQASIDTLDGALSQIFRASAVLKRLRQFVGQNPPKLETVDAKALLQEAIRLGGLAAKEVRADLSVMIDDATGCIRVDAVQFQQVMVNLLLNAADAVKGRSDRRIGVRAWRSENLLCVAIEDSGGGIPDADVDLIFEPFRTTKAEGLGVGLAICRSIIAAHGGSISCDTGGALGGSRFVFSLPAQSIRIVDR